LSRLDAYSLASITMDCRVGEMIAPEKSVHCLVPKSLWVQRLSNEIKFAPLQFQPHCSHAPTR